MNKPTLTSELMYCICGFSSKSGNKMAGHLARSGCTSSYPSQDEASRARVGDGDRDTPEEATVIKDKTSEDKTNEEMETGDNKNEDGEEVSDPDQVSNETEKENQTVSCSENGKESDTNPNENGKKEKDANTNEEVEKEKEKDPNEEEEGEKKKDDDDQAPAAAGGILFGTLFDYMNQKEEEPTNT